MKQQLRSDIDEQTSSEQSDQHLLKAMAILRSRNERLISVLGCVLESITEDMKDQVMSDQLKEDLDSANAILDDFEENPL